MNTMVTEFGAGPMAELGDRLRGYWRLKVSFLLISGALLCLTVLVAVMWPPTYRAGATILIEQQEIPQDLVRSAITSFADQRVQVISQRVMTNQNLMSLVDRYNLYPDIRENKPREVLLQRLRDDISMKMISADVIDPRSGHPTQATIAFSVSYQSHSPQLALKVANELTTLYLNENLNSRTQMAEQTTAFFAEEAAKQQTRIVELDKKLADYKKKHQDALPDLTQLNLTLSDRTESELHDVENRISSIDSQIVLLRAQLAQLNPTAAVFSDTGQRVFGVDDRLKVLKSQLASYKARYAPDHPDVISTEREIEGLEKEAAAQDGTADLMRELDDARAALGAARQKYSADHPDVIRLQRQVDELQKEISVQPVGRESPKAEVHPDNPVYIQVKGQLDALISEKGGAETKQGELRTKLDDYAKRIAQAPVVERDYRELARDLESAQLKYQQIKAKQGDVQVSENLEEEHKGERFTMIEPPLPPEKPVAPNRFLILMAGFILSLGAGLGAVALRDGLDPSVRGSRDLKKLLSVAPLAAIPNIVTAAEKRRRSRNRLMSGAAVLTTMGVATVLVHLYVSPLDVLWIALCRRFGV
ncbi:MAG TPA: hypothetical protein VHZ53_05685 [Steroidobacteraceae bacterium]|jgi:uncharacterized protein involved in exopolysaccharide biosynthesis|nr:hypothetical protein [Steroidobacteraceae bacterium]